MSAATLERIDESTYELCAVDETITVSRLNAMFDYPERVIDYEDIAKRCTIEDMQFLVKYGGLFSDLIGTTEPDDSFRTPSGIIDPDKLNEQGYRILEYEYAEAYLLAEYLSKIANEIIASGLRPELCAEYARVANEGFKMLRELAPIKGIDKFGSIDDSIRLVTLERGSLPPARMLLGVDKDADIPEEYRVVAKRIHLVGCATTDLANIIQWRNPEHAVDLAHRHVVLPDFVNPASYASSLAVLLTQRILSAQFDLGDRTSIDKLTHRSFAVTWQGLRKATQLIRMVTGIQRPEFASLAMGFELNQKYYLIGSRVVADAGDVLEAAGMMPSGYTR